MTTNTKTINSWDWDIRVRERMIRNGTLNDKEIEKQYASLPDLADHVDPVSVTQPALGGRED